jgi:hypothetical protein
VMIDARGVVLRTHDKSKEKILKVYFIDSSPKNLSFSSAFDFSQIRKQLFE